MLPKLVKSSLCLALTIAAIASTYAADVPKKRDITLDDLARLQRVGPPVISPDGEWILYTVSQVDTKEDKTQTHLWLVKWDGSVHLQLTYGKEGAYAPKFSPDGRYISFMSSRPGTVKGDQVWIMDRRGGEAEQLTNITDQNIQGYGWSPDSKKLLLTLHPKAEPDPEEGKPPVPQSRSSSIAITSNRTFRAICATTPITLSISGTSPPRRPRSSPPVRTSTRTTPSGRPMASGSPSSVIRIPIPIALTTLTFSTSSPKPAQPRRSSPRGRDQMEAISPGRQIPDQSHTRKALKSNFSSTRRQNLQS